MQLMTEELKKTLPKMYSSEDTKLEDKIVYAKFFTPDSNWTWFILEWDGEDTLFAMVHGHFEELGNVSLSELQSVRGPMRLQVERDLHFSPIRYGDIKC